jgi:quinol-cytochrome oxidoreductase complex cytochrome b subunit
MSLNHETMLRGPNVTGVQGIVLQASGRSNSRRKFKKKVLSWSMARKISSVVIFLALWTVVVQFIPNFKQIPPPDQVFMAIFKIKLSAFGLEIVRSL